MADNPKVFISYAHKDEEYEDKVFALANKLCAKGIDAMIDQFEEAPSEGWPRWMEKQITEAQFVLILCSEAYYRKLYNKTGKGVLWEASLIYQLLYDNNMESTKFIPAFFDEKEQDYIPLPLKPYTFYNLSNDRQFDKLYWRFRGVSTSKQPPLGALEPIPQKPRKTFYFTSPIELEKWNKAKWRGVFYLWYEDAPAIGFYFENFSAGQSIFSAWKKTLKGSETGDNLLKIDYIVRPFPKDCWVNSSSDRNYGKGYFVHIGSNSETDIREAEQLGLTRNEIVLATVSRYQWMNEKNGTINRNGFFDDYKKAGKYYILPVGRKNNLMPYFPENMMCDHNLVIPMKNIEINAGISLTDDNRCKAVLQKPEGY